MDQRLKSLDGVRGAAALVVVLHHLLLLSPGMAGVAYGRAPAGTAQKLLGDTPLRMLWSGPEAVLLFFLLSGYVLARRPLAGAPMRIPNYYWRRACRLYIPMAGSMAVALAVRGVPHTVVGGGSWWLNAHSPPSTRHDVISALWLFTGNQSKLNSVWWSLQWEAWFSLALPVVVLVCKPLRRHLWLFGLACLYAASWLPTQRHTFRPSVWDHTVQYMPIFGVGVAMAAYEPYLRRQRWAKRPIVGWLVLLAFGVVFWLHLELPKISRSLPLTFPQITALGTATTIVGAAGFLAMALTFGPLARLLSWGPLNWLGSRSYSLYLVHEPILVTLAFGVRLKALPLWFIVVGLAAAFIGTEIFYRLIELPSIRLGKWRPKRRRLRDRSLQLSPTTS